MDLFPFTFFSTNDGEGGVAEHMKSFSASLMPWLQMAHPENWPLTRLSLDGGVSEDAVDTDGTTSFDRLLHAAVGRVSGSLSPASIGLAFADWAIHFAFAPARRAQIAETMFRKSVKLALHTAQHAGDTEAGPCFEPRPGDKRFSAPQWCRWPFTLYYQAFLLAEEAATLTTHDIRGVSAHHERIVSFLARQWLDMLSPSNFLLTNPEAMDQTLQEGGANLVRGATNLAEDTLRTFFRETTANDGHFRPGHEVAITPGKVVFRNHLIELIQYGPQTEETVSEPLLIVPAWIMKYYILDLLPQNSLIGYLVAQGFTVFCISWRNPSAADRNISLADYRESGVMSALKVVRAIVPERKIHMLGYCLGGTLSAITASHLSRDGDGILSTLTLLCAETDFRIAGELRLFVDESQISFLEDIMWDKGYLRTDQMSGAFQLLRSADLIWSRNLRFYLLGKRDEPNELMAWNSDGTRLPYRMHSEYLRHLFLNNELAEGRYMIDGQPIALSDIRVPVFLLGTETDHVAPWKSVYRLHLYADTDITFTLTNGGHNAGVVSEPGHKPRHFRMATKGDHDPYIDGDTWVAMHAPQEGSWWPAYAEWLKAHSSGRVSPPPMGAPGHPPLMDAPGSYVLLR